MVELPLPFVFYLLFSIFHFSFSIVLSARGRQQQLGDDKWKMANDKWKMQIQKNDKYQDN
jgi:hypothetical protein